MLQKLQILITDEALILTPQNGLIGYPQQIQYGVSFRCLLNPKINFNFRMIIKIHTSTNSKNTM